MLYYSCLVHHAILSFLPFFCIYAPIIFCFHFVNKLVFLFVPLGPFGIFVCIFNISEHDANNVQSG